MQTIPGWIKKRVGSGLETEKVECASLRARLIETDRRGRRTLQFSSGGIQDHG
jgi:hypothetical protein